MLDMTGSDVNVLPNWPPTHNFPDLQLLFLSLTVFDGSSRCRELECLENLGLRVIANRCPAGLRSGCGYPPCCTWTTATTPPFRPGWKPSTPPFTTVTESWSTTTPARDKEYSTRAMTPAGGDDSGAETRRGMALDQFATAGISVGVIIFVVIIVICVLWKRGFRLGRVSGVGAASGGGANVNPNNRNNNPRVPPQQDSAFTPIFNRSRPLRPQQNHSFSPTFSTSRPRHMPTPRSSPLAFLFSRQQRPPTDAPPPPPPPPAQQHEAVMHYNPEYNGLPGNEEVNGRAGGMAGGPGDDRIYQNVELNIVPNREECRGSRNLLDFGLDSSNNSSNNLASHQGISADNEEEETANRRLHRNSSYSTHSGSPSAPLRHDTSYRVSAEGYRLPSQLARSQDRSSISGVHGMESIEEQQDDAPDVYPPSSGVADGEEEMWEEDDVGDDDAANFESEAGEHGHDGGSGGMDDGRSYDFPPPPSDEALPPPGRSGRGGRRRRNGGGGARAWGREVGRRLERHGE
ncbi:uncharacterized protein LOC129595128 isoform X2 [Paramacrobiotus metropolitanus]|uniref:uncharacterized protein LOC129595128 isoform X2 n=1 Tax=Paramacrobiotus metropolitanus TaxID=2943436 RepID=UPI002446398B|nr:uncharacterized protein LOC129595128 isoform X2 [Paramacrobiotus metropolitanus]XP_055348017.1 uncharacterized protein LOC129595128 isoform X2 [Paramacrobiotus metropolitanus]